jgi:hypothetical protein
LLLHPAAFDGLTLARVVDKDSSHQLRRNPEKMGAILPPGVCLFDQLYIWLINKRRRLKRVFGALTSQVVGG